MPRYPEKLPACWSAAIRSVAWEWMHGMPPETRDSYPPLQDGSFVFREERSSVEPDSLIIRVMPPVLAVMLLA